MKRDREKQYNSPRKDLGNPPASKENSSYAPRSPKLGGKYKIGRFSAIKRADAVNAANGANLDHPVVQPQAAPPAEIVQADVAITPPAAEPRTELPLPPHIQRNSTMTHFDSYSNRQFDAPKDLTSYNQRIFDLLHQQGNHFLYQNNKIRYWANYPSHDKAFIFPHPFAVHQLHLSKSPFGHNYRGTWVSAIARNRDGKVYPVHIITHNTLNNNGFATYPERIKDLFAGFTTPWPEGMQRYCLIIDAQTEAQKRKIINDYERLVTSYASKASQLLLDIRIYFERRLTKIYTPENCCLRELRFFRRPDHLFLDLTNKRAALLILERKELKAVRPDVDQDTFITACSAFIQSPNMAQELAKTHFSITEINAILDLITSARERMRGFYHEITTGFNQQDLASEDVKNLLEKTLDSINRHGETIAKLTSLRISYLRYSTTLANILSIDLSHLNHIYGLNSISHEMAVLVEANVYQRVNELMVAHGLGEQFRNHFTSGNKLLAWLIARDVPLNPQASSREQCRALVEHITLMMTNEQPLLRV